jgi:hypothetical protein
MDAPDQALTAEKLLRRGGRPHMDLQRQHHGTARLMRKPSTTSRHLAPLRLRHGPGAGNALAFNLEHWVGADHIWYPILKW